MSRVFWFTLFSMIACLDATTGKGIAAEREMNSKVREALATLKKENPKVVVVVDERTGIPSLIRGLEPRETFSFSEAPARTPGQIVKDFFAEQGEKLFLLAQPRREILVINERRDPHFEDQWTVRVQQTFQGIPIFGSQASVTVKPTSGVTSLAASFSPQLEMSNVQAIPRIKWHDAVRVALDEYSRFLRKMGKEDVSIEETPRPIGAELQILQTTMLGIDMNKKTHLHVFKDWL